MVHLQPDHSDHPVESLDCSHECQHDLRSGDFLRFNHLFGCNHYYNVIFKDETIITNVVPGHKLLFS